MLFVGTKASSHLKVQDESQVMKLRSSTEAEWIYIYFHCVSLFLSLQLLNSVQYSDPEYVHRPTEPDHIL